jgi:hypothetical protein
MKCITWTYNSVILSARPHISSSKLLNVFRRNLVLGSTLKFSVNVIFARIIPVGLILYRLILMQVLSRPLLFRLTPLQHPHLYSFHLTNLWFSAQSVPSGGVHPLFYTCNVFRMVPCLTRRNEALHISGKVKKSGDVLVFRWTRGARRPACDSPRPKFTWLYECWMC